MERRPGVPRLLREINDRAAFDLLVSRGPLTRSRLGELTGLSKVTAAQMLGRLEERGLVTVVGAQAGARGPNAALYAVRPQAAYVAGLEVGPHGVTTAVADITGQVLSEETVDPNRGDAPVQTVHSGVAGACRAAGIKPSELRVVVVGTPGVINPETGDLEFSFDLPEWHAGIRDALTSDLQCLVRIENDVNLVAVAERAYGAARDHDDFALVWADRGVGLAMLIGGRLHRGHSGAAGELGYLPVPGVPLAEDVRRRPGRLPSVSGGLGALVSTEAIRELADSHGLAGPSSVQEIVSHAIASGAAEFVDDLAHRLALGVASVCVILDPSLVVLAGDVCRAGGPDLAGRVEEAVARICPIRPNVSVTAVERRPVLLGAVDVAAEQAREDLFTPS
ncbi:ROK family transcriptional regulator [Flindersiella endophytica]